MALDVEIVTPERKLVAARADEVIAPGAAGLFGVRPGHTPLMSVLDVGVLTMSAGGVAKRFFVSGGFVEVGKDLVRVLADSAEPVESIDIAEAKQRVEQAQNKLNSISPSVPEYQAQSLVVKREQARVRAASTR